MAQALDVVSRSHSVVVASFGLTSTSVLRLSVARQVKCAGVTRLTRDKRADITADITLYANA